MCSFLVPVTDWQILRSFYSLTGYGDLVGRYGNIGTAISIFKLYVYLIVKVDKRGRVQCAFVAPSRVSDPMFSLVSCVPPHPIGHASREITASAQITGRLVVALSH
jgi:hypothetical protein